MDIINSNNPDKDIELNKATACFLNNYVNISITGKDAQVFLQGQLSCDLNEITNTGVGIGCYCNIKGRVLAYFDIFRINDGYLINLPNSITEKLISALKKYAIFSKVKIELENNLSTIAIFGANKNIVEHIKNEVTDIHQLEQPKNAYKLITTIKSLANLKVLFNNLGINNYGDDIWTYFLIKNHVPEISEQQSEQYLPAELNLDKTKAISFTKGCFMGQEVIARMKYIGTMKKSLKLLTITRCDTATIKNKITALGKTVGEIVNLVRTSENSYLALVLINNEVVKNNIELELDGLVSAKIAIN